MGIRSLSTSSLKTGVRRNKIWDQTVSFGSDFYQIASTNVGSGGVSSINFSSIPQDYTHLQIRIMSRSTTASTLSWSGLRLNGDSNSDNYKGHQLYGDGSSAVSDAFGSASHLASFLTTGSSSTSGIFGVAIIDILDYNNTNKYKTIKVKQGNDQNGSGYIIFHSGIWLSTSSITSMLFFDTNGGNYAQHSSFSLYGIKG
jgi:hypothetical protein